MGDSLSVPVDRKQIGLLVKSLREKRGLTTNALADRIGISQAQISRLENGKQGFRSSTLAKIANALDCDAVVSFVPRGHR